MTGTLSAELEAAEAGNLSNLEHLHRIRKVEADRDEMRALG